MQHKKAWIVVIAVSIVALGWIALGGGAAESTPSWAMKATIIEACSCPMFCQCYFNPEPSSHHGSGGEGHYCKFNNAFRVSSGNYGDVKLDGVHFWVAGDLGSDLADGEMDWAVLTFDRSVTEAQRAGVAEILGHVYPVKWKSFQIGEDTDMEWSVSDMGAKARLGGGKVAEVILKRMANHDHNPVIHGLNYWGVPRHEGFVLMPNEVEAYRAGDKAFEYGGGNGFVLSFDITSEDVSG